MEPAEFIRRCQEGGSALREAVETFCLLHGKRLLGDARAHAASPEIGEDLVHDAYLKLLTGCRRYRGSGSLLGWVQTGLRRSIIDHWRKHSAETSLGADGEEIASAVEEALLQACAAGIDPAAIAETAQARRVYEECRRRFAADHPQSAAVIAWVAEDGLSIPELADVLGRSHAATREHLSQCRKKARVYFADWYALVTTQRRLTA